MNLLNRLKYLDWYMTLDCITYVKSSLNCLNNTRLYNRHVEDTNRILKNLYLLDKVEDKIKIYSQISKKEFSIDEVGVFISPSISFIEKRLYAPYASTFFFLSNDECPKEEILRKDYFSLSVSNQSLFFLLNKHISDIITDMFISKIPIHLEYYSRYNLSIYQMGLITFCLSVISICVIFIFYLVCGIYSTKNPIITEFELKRFKLVKYKHIEDKSTEACLICFDVFRDDDDVRILFCNHYFHMECVDRWLCTQSSRCPYCRCTNKYYGEIV